MKRLCIAILFACATATAANARDEAKADLVDFKYRIEEDGGSYKTIRMVGTITNKSATELEASICLRLYDEDGFELYDRSSGKVRLTPGQSDTATGNGTLKSELWTRVVSLNAYVARYGCINSPGEAISPVVERKTTE